MTKTTNFALESYQVSKLKEKLQHRDDPIELFYFEELQSTNDFLLKKISEIEHQRAVVICQRQINGRGRFERKWQTIELGQITLSYLYRSPLGIESFKLLSIACAIESLIALERFGFEGIKIKWPNDLYATDFNQSKQSIKPTESAESTESTNRIKAKKLAGILIDSNFQSKSTNQFSENQSANQTDLIIGLGINLMMPSQEAKLQYQDFASLEKINPKVFNRLNKNQIALALIDAIEQAIENLEMNMAEKYIDLFNQYHLLIDQRIHFQTQDGRIIEGINQGINQMAELMIKDRDQQLCFSHGRILINQS